MSGEPVDISEFIAWLKDEALPALGAMGRADCPGLSVDTRECLEQLASASRELQDSVGDLLDLCELESGRIELLCQTFDLARLLRVSVAIHAFQAWQQGLGLALELEGEGPGMVLGDPLRLRQVLDSLLAEALALAWTGSRADEGRLVLTVRPEASRGPAKDGDLWLRFSVSGPGLTSGHAARGLRGALRAALVRTLGGFHSEPGEPLAFSLPFTLAQNGAGQAQCQEINRQRALELLGGNEALLRRLEGIFIQSAPETMEKLQAAVEAADFQAINLLAHNLKGISSTIGVGSAGRLAFLVEQAAADEDMERITEHCAELERELQQTLTGLRSALALCKPDQNAS